MDKISLQAQIDKIQAYEKGYRATRLINLGAQLGIFAAFIETEEGRTVSELAERLMLFEPFIKIWCQTAYHFDLLECDEQGRFTLQPFMDQVLGNKAFDSQSQPNIDLPLEPEFEMAVDEMLGKEDDLKNSGYYLSGASSEMDQSPEASSAQAEATKNLHVIFLSLIFPKYEHLKAKLEKGLTFLDVGCGSGDLILQLAREFENSRFLGIDPNIHGINEAQNIISQSNLTDRVHVESMGGQDLVLTEAFEMASMVITLHEIPPDVRQQTVENIYQALKPEGNLLILDFPYPGRLEDFKNPAYSVGVIEQYFEAPNGIVHIDTEEQDQLLLKAGFRNIEHMNIGEGMFDFITAVK